VQNFAPQNTHVKRVHSKKLAEITINQVSCKQRSSGNSLCLSRTLKTSVELTSTFREGKCS